VTSSYKDSRSAVLVFRLASICEDLFRVLANWNVVLGCAAFVLVLDGGVLAKDVATADSVNLVAGVAVIVFVFVEPECLGHPPPPPSIRSQGECRREQ